MRLRGVTQVAGLCVLIVAAVVVTVSAQSDRLASPKDAGGRLTLDEVLDVTGILPPPEILPAPRTPEGRPDLSGVYQMSGRRGDWDAAEPGAVSGEGAFRRPQWGPQVGLQSEQPSLTPAARERAQELLNRRSIDDPTAYCYPQVAARLMVGLFPTKFVQTKDELVVLYEYMGTFRVIPTDGRPQPEDSEPTYMGTSVGRWEGDTLVVDVANFIEGNWLQSGVVASDKLHVTERYTRVDKDFLLYEATYEDPELLTKPYTIRRSMMLREGVRPREYVCSENNLDPARYQEYLKRPSLFMRTPEQIQQQQ